MLAAVYHYLILYATNEIKKSISLLRERQKFSKNIKRQKLFLCTPT